LAVFSSAPSSHAIAQTTGGQGSYLGVSLVDIDVTRAKALSLDEPKGVLVVHVYPGTPASNAGIRPGDVLLTYNGQEISSAQQLGRMVWETPRGRHVRIAYLRSGNSATATVTTQAPPTQANLATMEDQPSVSAMSVPGFPMPEIPSPILIWRNLSLGIELEPVDAQLAEYFGVKSGLLVRFVVQGSPAHKVGLKAGDVITKAGDQPVSTCHDLSAVLRMRTEPNKPIQLGIERSHKALVMNIVPQDYPE
jgi:serine protease Do